MEDGRPGLEALAAQLGVKVTVGRRRKCRKELKADCERALNRPGFHVRRQHDPASGGEPTQPDATEYRVSHFHRGVIATIDHQCTASIDQQ